MKKKGTLWALFWTLLKVGLFTFGGGYAMLALLESEFVAKKNWMEKDEFLDMTAIAESTPGPIAINAATYIGYRQAGFLGSLVSTVAICIPSFLIIYTLSLFLDAFLSLTLVDYAFRGIRVCVVYLILTVGIKMLRSMKKEPLPLCIFSAVLLCLVLFSLLAIQFSTILYILISGCLGISLYFLRVLRKRKEDRA